MTAITTNDNQSLASQSMGNVSEKGQTNVPVINKNKKPNSSKRSSLSQSNLQFNQFKKDSKIISSKEQVQKQLKKGKTRDLKTLGDAEKLVIDGAIEEEQHEDITISPKKIDRSESQSLDDKDEEEKEKEEKSGINGTEKETDPTPLSKLTMKGTKNPTSEDALSPMSELRNIQNYKNSGKIKVKSEQGVKEDEDQNDGKSSSNVLDSNSEKEEEAGSNNDEE